MGWLPVVILAALAIRAHVAAVLAKDADSPGIPAEDRDAAARKVLEIKEAQVRAMHRREDKEKALARDAADAAARANAHENAQVKAYQIGLPMEVFLPKPKARA